MELAGCPSTGEPIWVTSYTNDVLGGWGAGSPLVFYAVTITTEIAAPFAVFERCAFRFDLIPLFLNKPVLKLTCSPVSAHERI